MAKKKKPTKQNKPATLTLSNDQIQRLDAVVKFKKDPLDQVKRLLAFLDGAVRDAGHAEITLSKKKLLAMIPTKSDLQTLSLLLPGAVHTLSEIGTNDGEGGDYDWRRCNNDSDDGDCKADPKMGDG